MASVLLSRVAFSIIIILIFVAVITNAQLSLAGSTVHRGAVGQHRAFLSMHMPGSVPGYGRTDPSQCFTSPNTGVCWGFLSAACGLSLQQFWSGSLCSEPLRFPRNCSGHSFPFQLFRGSYCAKMCWKLSPAVHLQFASGCHPATLTSPTSYC